MSEEELEKELARRRGGYMRIATDKQLPFVDASILINAPFRSGGSRAIH